MSVDVLNSFREELYPFADSGYGSLDKKKIPNIMGRFFGAPPNGEQYKLNEDLPWGAPPWTYSNNVQLIVKTINEASEYIQEGKFRNVIFPVIPWNKSTRDAVIELEFNYEPAQEVAYTGGTLGNNREGMKYSSYYSTNKLFGYKIFIPHQFFRTKEGLALYYGMLAILAKSYDLATDMYMWKTLLKLPNPYVEYLGGVYGTNTDEQKADILRILLQQHVNHWNICVKDSAMSLIKLENDVQQRVRLCGGAVSFLIINEYIQTFLPTQIVNWKAEWVNQYPNDGIRNNIVNLLPVKQVGKTAVDVQPIIQLSNNKIRVWETLAFLEVIGQYVSFQGKNAFMLKNDYTNMMEKVTLTDAIPHLHLNHNAMTKSKKKDFLYDWKETGFVGGMKDDNTGLRTKQVIENARDLRSVVLDRLNLKHNEDSSIWLEGLNAIKAINGSTLKISSLLKVFAQQNGFEVNNENFYDLSNWTDPQNDQPCGIVNFQGLKAFALTENYNGKYKEQRPAISRLVNHIENSATILKQVLKYNGIFEFADGDMGDAKTFDNDNRAMYPANAWMFHTFLNSQNYIGIHKVLQNDFNADSLNFNETTFNFALHKGLSNVTNYTANVNLVDLFKNSSLHFVDPANVKNNNSYKLASPFTKKVISFIMKQQRFASASGDDVNTAPAIAFVDGASFELATRPQSEFTFNDFEKIILELFANLKYPTNDGDYISTTMTWTQSLKRSYTNTTFIRPPPITAAEFNLHAPFPDYTKKLVETRTPALKNLNVNADFSLEVYSMAYLTIPWLPNSDAKRIEMLQTLAENNIEEPFGVIATRRRMLHRGIGGLWVNPGKTGNVVMGGDYVNIGDDPIRETHIVNSKGYRGFKVVNRKDIALEKTMMIQQCYGGSGTSFEKNDPILQRFEPNDVLKSVEQGWLLVPIAVPYNFTPKDLFDLSQRYFPEAEFTTFDRYNLVHNWSKIDAYLTATHTTLPIEVEEGEPIPDNCICYRAYHEYIDKKTGELIKVLGNGHFEKDENNDNTRRYSNLIKNTFI